QDKDSIKKIEICTSEYLLPENCSLIDTPGIDAADDADRLMTESALHIIDVLFYVMDYNHVQSEVNLYFLQKIQQKNIPLYIIINQIDKHNDSELSFDQFDERVKQTFDQWAINPKKIYYSSVIQEDAANNQIKEIKTELFSLFNDRPDVTEHIYSAMREIVQDHKNVVTEQYDETMSRLKTDDEPTVDIEELEKLNEKINELSNLPARFRKEWENEVHLTLKNAYLMPAKLRDQAGYFLESQQKGFKVGFFKAKKKTEEEKKNRLNSFLNALQKTIESTIQWKLRDKFNHMLRSYQVNNEKLLKIVQQFDIRYHKDHLFSFIKPGATINGNYILNYTNDISNDIKNKFRQEANNLLETIEKTTVAEWRDTKRKYEEEKQKFEAIEAIQIERMSLKKQLQEKLATIDTQLETPKTNKINMDQLLENLKLRQTVTKEKAPIKQKKLEGKVKEEKDSLEKEDQQEIIQKYNSSVETMITTIEKVTNEIKNIDGFSAIVNDLEHKKERLHHRKLTIALFGAFSAGKSSFSNALFGEQILPVSPNPTTAVISRITPITEKYNHGTVLITLKDEKTLVKDIQTIIQDLKPNESNFQDLIHWIRENQIHEHHHLTKTYQSYLLAILAGYEARKNQLGKSFTITLEEFPAFVTDESKACYIESVDLYYDCELTRKGITLVDTPGADSVNARHTNVAFDYIKQADAIIYVTYFNHAVTSADRDFLIQLGRVKESFELDKMFFIVNASDLASNQEELKLVVNYVEKQLSLFGIRHPKIYPVSSKQSLEEKVNNRLLNEQMHVFENDFYTFIEEDLASLTIQAAKWDMERAKLTLNNFISSAKLDEKARENHINQLNKQRNSFKQLVTETDIDVSKERIMERIERQLHFVLERLYIRFHDIFSEHFNPTTITKSGRHAMVELERNRNRLIDAVGYELLQEVRAVTLRIEAYVKELLQSTYQQIQEEMRKVNDTFILSSFESADIHTPEYEQAFTNVNVNLFTSALKVFKNTKSFFEQNEREKMKDQFYDILQPLAKDYLLIQKEIMENTYREQWINAVFGMKTQMKSEIDEMTDHHIKLLTEVVHIRELEEKYTNIEFLINTINEDDDID
ncbi:MAG TPA: dynamin family protein, partial [Pseudogracilibacillus sp.]|nr:dynamin family protein [Pseudogracilibacillus sp.]